MTERTTSAAETEALGARLAAALEPGDVVLVSGELGAGKTTLVRGACRELGVEGPVTSPTFTIGQRYVGATHPVSHLDLYRLEGLGPEEPGLLEDYLTPDAISLSRVAGGRRRRVRGRGPGWRSWVASRVELRHAGGDERDVSVEAV